MGKKEAAKRAEAEEAARAPLVVDAVPTALKRVDDRVKTVVDNASRLRHRCMFFILGQTPQRRVETIYSMVGNKAQGEGVLWCYHKEPCCSSSARRRDPARRKAKEGETTLDDDFDRFLRTTKFRWCKYKDTQGVLGRTFSMCVLQDFDALTPDLLARTIQTVAAGGAIVFLLSKLSDVRSLGNVTMDVHKRFCTDAHRVVKPRFNERMVLSLKECDNFLLVNEELQVVPFADRQTSIRPVDKFKFTEGLSADQKALRDLKNRVKVSEGEESNKTTLIHETMTLDQGQVLEEVLGVLQERSLRTTLTLTASRGRGKSAALGLAVAGSVAEGYSNIFVTAPTPQNLGTFFEFVERGLKALGYTSKANSGAPDYEVVQSVNPDFHKAIIRINIFKSHRQTVQYIEPRDARLFEQAELVVIDEAAAIPLPVVRSLLGPYTVFMASTVNGYEGTGRALSLKLIKSLRDQAESGKGGRSLKETQLEEPIRYGRGDPIERWLNGLLCLEVASVDGRAVCQSVPQPSQCELFYVNLDNLFSFNSYSEQFLQRVVWLSASSHYRNSPNDLQMLSDAPGHHLFVLCAIRKGQKLPDLVGMVQVVEEGGVAERRMQEFANKGQRPSGDMLPFTLAGQFQWPHFGKKLGLRVHRIAVHPSYPGMGYGSRMLELMHSYYSKEVICDLQEGEKPPTSLLIPLNKRPCGVDLDYTGTSFGITSELFGFWQRNGYKPVYMRPTQNELTGEHTVMMLRGSVGLESSECNWLRDMHTDFRWRFARSSSGPFRHLLPSLVASIMTDSDMLTPDPGQQPAVVQKDGPSDKSMLGEFRSRSTVRGAPQIMGMEDLRSHALSEFDLRRARSYDRQMVDLPVILDLAGPLARLYFGQNLMVLPSGKPGLRLTSSGALMLAGLGLQNKSINEIGQSTDAYGRVQMENFYHEVIRQFGRYLSQLQEEGSTGAEEEGGKQGAPNQGKRPASGDSEEAPPAKKQMQAAPEAAPAKKKFKAKFKSKFEKRKA